MNKLQSSKFLVRCWMFTLLLVTAGSHSITAQPLQKIFSGLDNPTSISVTQNSIYIVEQGKNRLLKLDHSGILLETIGGRGSGDYQFSKPVDVDATNGLKIFVTDLNNRRVQVFDRRGQFLSSLTARNWFGIPDRYHPTQMTVNDLGEILLVDENRRRILRFDLDYNLQDEFRIPSEIKKIDDLIVSQTELLAFERTTKTLHRLRSSGSYDGFYPAEEVHAVAVTGQGIWMVYEDRAVFESRDGTRKTIEFGLSVKAKDVAVQRSSLFILGENFLYTISIPS